jgi:hypothetical protein
MGFSSEIFIKMSEQEYALVPNEIKERFFSSKNITKETNDWSENMKDPTFEKLYVQSKQVKKQLEERQYQLRESRRKPL